MYNLIDETSEYDNFRRSMERRYRERIEQMVNNYRLLRQAEIKEKFNAMGVL
jgi:hypothetical protein